MSHSTAIGFNIASFEELAPVSDQAFREGRRLDSPKGSYYYWPVGDGAEIWLQVDGKQFLGMNPFFSSGIKTRVLLQARPTVSSPSPLDGAYYAWADPSKGSGEEQPGAYPFIFDAPDYLLHGGLELPLECDVFLTAFADEATLLTQEEFKALEQPKYGAESFIPAGLFTGEDKNAHATSDAVMSGIVIKSAVRTNPFTRLNFHWVQLRTYGAELDVVLDPDMLPRLPQAGEILRGQFWMTGRLDRPWVEQAAKQGFLRRLFSRS